MITRASKSTSLRLEIEKSIKRQDANYFVQTTTIRIPLHSPLFRDLFLILIFNIDGKSGNVSNVKCELSEIGWGMPGLVSDDTRATTYTSGSKIEFTIICSIELKAGSEHGITIPLPFPKHRGQIVGWYDHRFNSYSARFDQYHG